MTTKKSLKLSELVARDIVSDISERGLHAGDRLKPESEMMEQYGVGRASLREALRLLEVQGLVETKPGLGGGLLVGGVEPSYLGRTISLYLRMTGATYGSLCEYVELIEPRMTEMAARRVSSAEARKLFAFCYEPLEDDRADISVTMKAARKENQFHPLVHSLSGNPVMALLMDAVTALVSEHMLQNLGSANFLEQTHCDHIEIADAIIAKQPVKARRLMFNHLKHVHDFYRERVPGMFGQPVEWR